MRTDFADIKLNIFPAAHAAIQWERFRWHRWAQVPRSSQALAIDVFGTIKAAQELERSRILGALAERCGLPPDGPWEIELEWPVPRSVLGEPRPTQVDVLAAGKRALLVIECKFSEAGGSCSQVRRRNGSAQCNGKYALQTNPTNNITHRCALTAKGVKYWDLIPEIYGFDALTDQLPCPFAGEDYQWMRNVVLARRLAMDRGILSTVIAAFADVDGLPTAMKARAGSLGSSPATGAALIFQSRIKIL